jgi:hypothetical protein
VRSGKWEVGSGKWEVGSGKWEVGSGKWEVGSGKWSELPAMRTLLVAGICCDVGHKCPLQGHPLAFCPWE